MALLSIQLYTILSIQCQVQGQKSLNRKGNIFFFIKVSNNKQMFDVILIGESISLITLMIKGHLQV